MNSVEKPLGFGLEGVQEDMKYYAWLAQVLHPHLGGRVLEHGAGTGALSETLLALGLDSAVLSEPTPHLAAMLREKFDARPNVSVFEGTVEQVLSREGKESVGSIVSSNVLEHIEDDVACLKTMWQLLVPGGSLALYVPARPELYGAIDRAVGHCRRYRRAELVDKVSLAGFDVQSAKYRNVIGGLGWFVTGRVLGKSDISNGSMRAYDQIIFPITRFLEDLLPPPWGQNLLLFAAKPKNANPRNTNSAIA
jgi:phospholipid N-methyltransferase